MATCAFCKVVLSPSDIEAGKCSACGQALPVDAGAAVPAGPSRPDHGTMSPPSASEEAWRAPEPGTEGPGPQAGAAGPDQVVRTIQAAGPSAPAPSPEKGTADADEVSKTFQAVGTPADAPEKEKGTADEKLIAKTFQAAGPAAPPPGKENGTAGEEFIAKTLQFPGESTPQPEKETGTADEERIAKTIKLAGPSAPSPQPEEGAGEGQVARTVPGGGATPAVAPGGELSYEARVADTIDRGAPSDQPPKEKGTAGEDEIAKTIEVGKPDAPKKPGTAGEVELGQTHDSGNIKYTPLPIDDDSRKLKTVDSGSRADMVERVSLMWSGKFDEDATPRTSIKAGMQSIEEASNLVIRPKVLRGADEPGTEYADYELRDILGEGGMGVVVAARQASIDRVVALKKIKPQGAKDLESRRKFLSEAVVTGELEHPNIVPIYDLGKDESGTLFYAMKHVQGTPWDRAIQSKSFQENLEIWMKVADAVGFAHSRGVVHRDLKPENVMLGGYGEVLLMDWGLAIEPGKPSARSAGMAGTPAYMAPEMAIGPIERISFPSDIYLLGAILFEVVTGKTPHTAATVTACLLAAARNEIQTVDKPGELVDIAMKAMATEAQDRYSTVTDLQEAVRQYRSHSESISLSTRADDDLREAAGQKGYESNARALFAFQEAEKLWTGNARARSGIVEATLVYAEKALRNEDYDLGVSLLNPADGRHAPLLQQLREAQHERNARQRRLKTARRIGTAAMASVLVVVTVAFFWIRSALGVAQEEKSKAVASEKVAIEETKKANDEKDKADKAAKLAAQREQEANHERDKADKAAKLAAQREQEAKDEKNKADMARDQQAYAAYIARMGLAAAKIEENAFDQAREILGLYSSPDPAKDPRSWEWRRLDYLCQRQLREHKAESRIDAVACTTDGERIAVGRQGGTVEVWDESFKEKRMIIHAGGEFVFALAFSPNGDYLATGTNERPNALTDWNEKSGYLKIWDARLKLEKPLEIPLWCPRPDLGDARAVLSDAVVSIAWSNKGDRLLTGSYGRQLPNGDYNNTARLWDVADLKNRAPRTWELAGHKQWVSSVGFSPDRHWMLTASGDSSVMIWPMPDAAPKPKSDSAPKAKADSSSETKLRHCAQLRHRWPVYAAAFSPDSSYVASAGYDRHIHLWCPGGWETSTGSTLRANPDGPSASWESTERSLPYLDLAEGDQVEVKGTKAAGGPPSVRPVHLSLEDQGHTAPVRSLAFSPDGNYLASGGHDNTVRVWSVAGRDKTLYRNLRGHGNRVSAVAFAGGANDKYRVVSGSHDQSVKLWDMEGYEEYRRLQAQDRVGLAPVLAAAAKGHSEAVLNVAFSNDGQFVISAGRDRTGRIWDLSGRLLTELQEGHKYLATMAAFFPDGSRFLTAGADNSMRVWDTKTGTEVWSQEGTGVAAAVALSCDGKWILAGGEEYTEEELDNGKPVKEKPAKDKKAQTWYYPTVWDAQPPKAPGRAPELVEAKGELPEHPMAVTAVAISPGNRWLLTGDSLGTCRLWDFNALRKAWEKSPERPARLRRHEFHAFGRIWEEPKGHVDGVKAAFFCGDDCLLTSGNDLALVRWRIDAATGKIADKRLLVHPNAITSLAVSAASRLAVTSCVDKIVRVWEVDTGKLKDSLAGKETVAAAEFSPDGQYLVTTSSDGKVRSWNLKGMKEVPPPAGGTELLHFTKVMTHAWTAVFSPDNKYLLTVGGSEARLWPAGGGEEIMSFIRQDSVAAARFSPDGKFAITGSWDNLARVWDLKALADAANGPKDPRAPLARCPAVRRLGGQEGGHEGYVNDCLFLPDDKRVLTASEKKIYLWDWRNEKALGAPFEGHTKRVRSIALDGTSQGNRFVSASEDGDARIWDCAQPQPLVRLKGPSQPPSPVFCAAFSPDGKKVLTGSEDGLAFLWDAQTGKQLLQLKGHTAGITSVAFSPDGLRALTGSRDTTVKLWELKAEGNELLTLKGHAQEVTAVAFSRKGEYEYIATGSQDGTLILWPSSGKPLADPAKPAVAKSEPAQPEAKAPAADQAGGKPPAAKPAEEPAPPKPTSVAPPRQTRLTAPPSGLTMDGK